MNNIYSIFKKELRSYFDSPIAYIFIIIFVMLSSWLTIKGIFIEGQAHMRSFFSLLPWFFIMLVPAITMRLWSEEKKLGTIELLMTTPITDFQAVMGKYLAALTLLILTLLSTIAIPLTVKWLGRPDMGPIWGGYIGGILMGAAYLAIGCFISSTSENQIISFIIAVAACFGLFIVGEPFVVLTVPNWMASSCQWLGLGTHFSSIERGVIDSRDLLYYLSIIVLFLYMSTRTVALRKWR